MILGSQCKKNQLIWIYGLKDTASKSLNSNLSKFKFKQCKHMKILVLKYSPGLYEYTGKRIDEFGVIG